MCCSVIKPRPSNEGPADLLAEARAPRFRAELTDVLLRLCAIDTTAQADVLLMRDREAQAFAVIRQALVDSAGRLAGRFMTPAIDARIAQHSFYSQPAYTITSNRPQPLSAADTYRGRTNLYFLADGAGCQPAGLALNAHIDVVHPFLPPRVEGDVVFGRGACDDKGPLVGMIGAINLVARHLQRTGRRLARPLTAMFVIEEEMGGNGSLSAACDADLRRRYDAIGVLECTSGQIHPGNRGAVWYKIEASLPGLNATEAAAFIVGHLERAGRAIKAESRHDLFPHRPVQTCHGILGPFGQHPSRICGQVEFEISLQPAGDVDRPEAQALIEDVLASGLAAYTGLYGDKTKVLDATTGKPKVARHYDLARTGSGWRVSVWGATGHMGSILENDGAITKTAALIRALVLSRAALERVTGGAMMVRLAGWPEDDRLSMEGGQGFLPTHAMSEVQERLTQAARQGLGEYLYLIGRPVGDAAPLHISFDKLHNAAFAGPRDSLAMRDALAAAHAARLTVPDASHIRGWDVSCDARIFACEYPDLTVLTMGPGHLRYAHADDEQLNLPELVQFVEFLARFILLRCGVAA